MRKTVKKVSAEDSYDLFTGFLNTSSKSTPTNVMGSGTRVSPADLVASINTSHDMFVDNSGGNSTLTNPAPPMKAKPKKIKEQDDGLLPRTNKLVPGKWVVFKSNKGKEQKPAGDASPKTDADDVKREGITNSRPKKLKNDYHPVAQSVEEVSKWRQNATITVFGDCPPPIISFHALPKLLCTAVLPTLENRGFTVPTAIQAQGWPVLLAGQDFVGIAKTGSGKTLAYVLPGLMKLFQSSIGDGSPNPHVVSPSMCILAPTRELAIQIQQETKLILVGQLASVNCAAVYGGTSRREQMVTLNPGSGVQILVATPGRLIDFLESNKVSLASINYFVIDEADRMLDMGFSPQLRQICEQCPENKQTAMFSATWPKEIQGLANTFLHEYCRVHVGSLNLQANADVKQQFVFTARDGKIAALHKLLRTLGTARVLIFVNTKVGVAEVESQLHKSGLHAMSLHGEKDQASREYILRKFREAKSGCLVATDVAARGLDIDALEYVINYEFPFQIDDYVHRIGRTGRAGNQGCAFTFFTKHERYMTVDVLRRLIDLLTGSKNQIPQELADWLYDKDRYLPQKRVSQRGGIGEYRHGSRPSSRQTEMRPPPGLFGIRR